MLPLPSRTVVRCFVRRDKSLVLLPQRRRRQVWNLPRREHPRPRLPRAGNTLRRPRRTSRRPQAPNRSHQKRLGRSRPGQNGDTGRGVVWVIGRLKPGKTERFQRRRAPIQQILGHQFGGGGAKHDAYRVMPRRNAESFDIWRRA